MILRDSNLQAATVKWNDEAGLSSRRPQQSWETFLFSRSNVYVTISTTMHNKVILVIAALLQPESSLVLVS